MYIETVPNRKSPPAVLLREGWREGKRVRKRTLANLTSWPAEKVETLRRLLKNEPLVSRDRRLRHYPLATATATSLPYSAPCTSCASDRTIASATSPERDRVLALITARILAPGSKLATARGLAEATARDSLASVLGLGEIDEDDLYAAMDWLLERQDSIERRLAKRIYKTVRWCSTT